MEPGLLEPWRGLRGVDVEEGGVRRKMVKEGINGRLVGLEGQLKR
jgi:hypothetical protein